MTGRERKEHLQCKMVNLVPGTILTVLVDRFTFVSEKSATTGFRIKPGMTWKTQRQTKAQRSSPRHCGRLQRVWQSHGIIFKLRGHIPLKTPLKKQRQSKNEIAASQQETTTLCSWLKPHRKDDEAYCLLVPGTNRQWKMTEKKNSSQRPV
jgi:hypothetical protein